MALAVGSLMGPKESIQQVSCPSCGAKPRQRCFNVQDGVPVDDPAHARYHMCHVARVKLYEKRGRPIEHDNWPVTRLKT